MFRKLIKKLDSVWAAFLFIGVVSIAFTLCFGSLLSLIGGDWTTCVLMTFFCFGAAPIAGGLLLVLFKIDMRYGIALYYGTIIIATMLKNFIPNPNSDYFISFIIMSLICYCFFLKQKLNKSRLNDSDE